jgi:hypothetical protein
VVFSRTSYTTKNDKERLCQFFPCSILSDGSSDDLFSKCQHPSRSTDQNKYEEQPAAAGVALTTRAPVTGVEEVVRVERGWGQLGNSLFQYAAAGEVSSNSLLGGINCYCSLLAR